MGKVVRGTYRVKLLQTFSNMNLSESLQLKISRIIGNCDKSMREQKAKSILDLIQNCKTEKEVLQKLKL